MGRALCCDNANVKKGPWSPDEDSKLKEYMHKYGTGGNWLALPQKVGLKRCGKSCRLRWLNYLRPNLKHGGFSEKEDNIICSLYVSIGSRWSIIAAQLPGRTDNDIKNYWNTKLKKKLLEKSKDHQTSPVTEAKQERKSMQHYARSDDNTVPNIYGPEQQDGGVDHHSNMGINGPYSKFTSGITSQLIEQNCGSRITESPMQASNSTSRASQISHSTTHNQYNSPEGRSDESTSVNSFNNEGNNNMAVYGFWTELNDLYYAIMTDKYSSLN